MSVYVELVLVCLEFVVCHSQLYMCMYVHTHMDYSVSFLWIMKGRKYQENGRWGQRRMPARLEVFSLVVVMH